MTVCCPIHDTRFDTVTSQKFPTHDKGHPDCPLAFSGVCYPPGKEPVSKPPTPNAAAWGSPRVIA